jgi:hypothetical protein
MTSSFVINSVRYKLLENNFENYSDIDPGGMVEQYGKLEESTVYTGLTYGSRRDGVFADLEGTLVRGSYNRKCRHCRVSTLKAVLW